jgi:carbamoyltransferase
MKILSVYPWTHISSSALMIDGKLVSASAEERFSKQKWSTKFPIKSAEWCLKINNLTWDDIDHIVIPWNPAHNIHTSNSRWDSEIVWRGQLLSHVPSNLMKAKGGNVPSRINLSYSNTNIIYANHHDCHAASAAFISPFKNCDYLIIDGHGETEACTYGYFDGKKLHKKGYVLYPHSVGLLYGSFTNFLGFTPDKDEWKTMALASYSVKANKYDSKISKVYNLTKEGLELDLTFFDYYLFDKKPAFYNKKFKSLFGQPRKKNEKLERRHFEIAGSLQRAFEKIVIHLLKITKKHGRSQNIVIAGGAAMNCVFNGKLNNLKFYKNNFVPPWPDDLGVSVGATLLIDNEKTKSKNIKKYKKINCYLGPNYSNQDIVKTFKKYKLKYKYSQNVCKETAKLIKNGKLIGWFQGKMEFTHRALGNRSILADPRSSKVKNLINSAVKYRESFRPFAPAVLSEHANDIFEIRNKEKIDYMQKAVVVKKKWRKIIPGVTHSDSTARVQTVDLQSNKKFYDLINEFYKLTKVPVLVNTSFNLNGQPIVMDPEDAIKTFYTCGLDYLVLENYIVSKDNV